MLIFGNFLYRNVFFVISWMIFLLVFFGFLLEVVFIEKLLVGVRFFNLLELILLLIVIVMMVMWLLIKFWVIFLVIFLFLDDLLFVMIISICFVFGFMVLLLVKSCFVFCNVLFNVDFFGMFDVEFINFISWFGFVILLENFRIMEGLFL